jgi:methylated-DNA-[protein]-cysteine S-methyltransferase
MDLKDTRFCVFDTAAGSCGIAWSAQGVVRFALPERTAAASGRELRRRLPGTEPGPPPRNVAGTIAAAIRYFDGIPTHFTGCDLDLEGQDAFFVQVYGLARQVGWGQTTTYGTLAGLLGAGQQGARDVGRAMAGNPVPLVIPCHRVLAAGGRPGGFSATGGVATKIRMLELEGIPMTPAATTQMSFGF